MRKRLMIAIIGIMALVGLSVPAALAAGHHHHPAAVTRSPADTTSHIFMGDGYTMTNQFPTGDSATASFFFDRSKSFGTGSSTSSNPISNSYATTPCLVYTSEAQFVSDINNSVIPNATWPAGSCVFYDTEDWTQTPTAEQQDPESYMPAFNTEAVSNGFVPWDSPALDLGNVDTTCPKSTHGGTNVTWYEQCHIAKYAATNDPTTAPFGGVVVQNQSQLGVSETDYVALYRDAEADVDGVNASTSTLTHTSNAYGTASDASTYMNNIGVNNCDGMYMTTTNADASSAEGYADAVFELLKSASW